MVQFEQNKTVGVSPGVGGHISDGARQGGQGGKIPVWRRSAARE